MKRNQSGSIKSVGNIGNKGVLQLVQQRKTPFKGPDQSSTDSIVVRIPPGFPPSFRQQVTDAIECCMVRILSAVTSIQAVGSAMTSGVNRITVSGNEYMLQTANGEVVYLKDNKATRLLLMVLCNPDMSLPIQALIDAETHGHLPLRKNIGNWTGAKRHGDSEEDGNSLPYEDELHSATTDLGEVITPEAKKNYERKLLEIIAKRKEAVEEGNEDLIEELDDATKAIKNEIIRGTTKPIRDRKTGAIVVPSRIRHWHTPEDAKHIHRIRVYLDRAIEVIRHKDEELANHLHPAIKRNGSFCYPSDPMVKWEICERAFTISRDDSQKSVLVED